MLCKKKEHFYRRAPEPFGGWMGERLATTDAPLCTQRDPYRRDESISGIEDCLQLNIYVPERSRNPKRSLAQSNESKSLPVMVFFHGGGWQCGSGTRSFYGPDYLLEHDIIYIGANFRLGPLGFLSTEQADCPGNNGLKDQNLVLRWIRENIASFGGDPHSVTLWDTDPMIPFPPVVEPDAPGAFITKHPRDEYEPHGIGLPWMTGLTLDEGALKSAFVLGCLVFSGHG
uniref:carboxylesterase n=1 Tax=Anopheles maculatus TaxID=74869 RepID=A0A182SV11_9DIPT